MSRPVRRGVSTLFVVGCVLWAAVFAGIAYLKFGRTTTNEPKDDPRTRPGTLVLDEKDEEPDSEPVVFKDDDGKPLPMKWNPDGIDDFELTERSGRKVTKQDLLGKPWVVAFVFTRCQGPCPMVSKAMHDLQRATEGLDLRLVTVSVDPEHDTPEVLTRYAELFQADSDRWLFLTGDEDDVYTLIGRSFKMPVSRVPLDTGDGKYDVIHTSNVLYVDAEGVVRAKYNSLNDEQIGELKQLLRREVPKLPADDE